MNNLLFSSNWNNKLSCKCFTTFRMYNPTKYYVGARFNVQHGGRFIKMVEVIDVKKLKLSEVNEWIARIDTGYSREEFINIVRTMYKTVNDLDNKTFCLLLLKEI